MNNLFYVILNKKRILNKKWTNIRVYSLKKAEN